MKKIIVSVAKQEMIVQEGEEVLKTYPVSTSRYGIGFEPGSYKTPLGNFIVAEKIGGDQPINTIFVGRKPVGVWNGVDIDQEYMTTRILWLDGKDTENANTKDRYIYVHGTNDEHLIGFPASHGCVRMKNSDMVELFDRVEEGILVVIEE